MPVETTQIVNQVFCSVMQELAFMLGEPVDQATLPNELDECLEARIGFSGHFSGQLRLMSSPDMAREIAANLLGIEIEDLDSAQQSDDALGEALNVICGQLLTALAGEEAVFNLSPPEVAHCDSAHWQHFREDPRSLGFLVDTGVALLWVDLQDAV